MVDTIGMTAQAVGNAARLGCYLGLNRLVDWRTRALGRAPVERPSRPMPSERELLVDLARVLLRDAAAVRDRLYPPMSDETSPYDLVIRVRSMLADLPEATRRQGASDAGTAARATDAATYPDYYTQDFHFQTDGYLSAKSARLYDLQVETLFLGAAAVMRREALRPIADFMAGRDQRKIRLLDVACGTGRLLRSIRLSYPAMNLAGLDLSEAYLDEARHHMGGLRPAAFLTGNAEAIPLPDASQDIVTTVFLFHELPPEVRRRVTAEMARVLRPGGLLVFIDSLQMGDRPGWDGVLEQFPARFHEPYYRHYAIDDLERLFGEAGLAVHGRSQVFLSKMIAATRV